MYGPSTGTRADAYMMTEDTTETTTLGRMKSRRIMRHAQGGRAGAPGLPSNFPPTLASTAPSLPSLLVWVTPDRELLLPPLLPLRFDLGGRRWVELLRPPKVGGVEARLNAPVATASGNAYGLLDQMFYVSGQKGLLEAAAVAICC